jgi:hypothetical protein
MLKTTLHKNKVQLQKLQKAFDSKLKKTLNDYYIKIK